jgi:hypothetical protein
MANHPNRSNRLPDCIPPLVRAGIDVEDAWELRKIAMRLHRWHELECGVEGGGVERNEETGKVTWYSSHTGQRTPYSDRETPALTRLAAIMAKYPTLGHYVQGDPRGAPLYILPPGTIPAGENVDAYYNRGIVVYK